MQLIKTETFLRKYELVYLSRDVKEHISPKLNLKPVSICYL